MEKWIRSYIAIAALLLVLTTVGLWAAYNRMEGVVEEYARSTLLHSKHLAASEIGNWLNRMAAVVEGVDSFIVASHDNDASLPTYLAAVQETNSFFSGVFFGRADGSFAIAPHWDPPADYDHHQRVWYQMAIQADGVLFSDFYDDAAGHGRITSVVKAVRNSEGELLGVVGADLPLTFMESHVHHSLPEQDSIHFVIDARGNVLQLCGEWAMDEPWFPELMTLLSAAPAMGPDDRSDAVEFTHGEGLLTMHEVPLAGWHVVSYLPGGNVTGASTYVLGIFALISVGGLLAFGLLFVLQRRWFVLPLLRLEKDIDGINPDSDLGYRLANEGPGTTHGVRGVVNGLLTRLQSTIESLQADEEELRAANEEMEAANQQLAAAEEELRHQHNDLIAQQEKLASSEEYNRSIVALIPDLLVRYDSEGRYLDIVTGREDQLWLSETEVEGKVVEDVLPGEAGRILQQGITNALNRNHLVQLEYTLPNRKGEGKRHFEARLLPKGSEVYALIRDISDRRRAEAKEAEWHQLMQYIIQHDPNAIAVFDRDLHYIYVSQRYLKDYKVKQPQIIGSHHYDIFPEIPERWRQVHQRCLQGEVLSGEDDRFERADGSVDYTRWECRPWYDGNGDIGGIITYTEVITEQRQTQEALADSEAYRQSLLDLIPDIVIQFDAEGRYMEILAGPGQTLIQPKDELIGRRVRDVLSPRAAAAIEGAIHRTLATNVIQEIEYTLEGKTDSQRWFAARILPLGAQQVLAVIRDTTAQHVTEQELTHIAYHDGLTDLHNRRAIEEILQQWETKTDQPASVVLLDVNGLKIVNDSLGHPAGDDLLRRAGQVLQTACPEEAVLGRWGGDEFIALLPTDDGPAIDDVSAGVLQAAAADDGGPVPLSMAIGTAIREKGQTMTEVIKRAEDEMYRHKNRHSQSSRSALVRSLQRTLEAKSFETHEHCEHLETWAVRLAKRIGLTDSVQDEVALLAALHDLGKVGIAESILTKNGPLNEEEWKVMKTHPEIGHRIAMASPDLVQVAEGILSHHERWDGAGYPRGLKEEEIPISARIVSIADAFEAMLSDRPYRKSIGGKAALEEIEACAGYQFDPTLAAEFVQMVREESPEILGKRS